MTNRSSQETPKGRINVRFEVDTNGQKQEVSLPYKVLYAGDLRGDAPRPDLREREPVAVDLDNFDEVLASHTPALALDVPDHIGGDGGQTARVELAFRALDDFTPDRLLELVPALRQLKARYDALAAIRYPLDADRGGLARRIAELLADARQRDALRSHYDGPTAAGEEDPR